MDIEKLRKMVKDNGLKLHIKGVHDVSGDCRACTGEGCYSGCSAVCRGRSCSDSLKT